MRQEQQPQADRGWLLPLLLAAAAAALVAAVGATLTDLGPWYQSLRQPSWAPPDGLYPVAWTSVFALWTVAAATAWRALPDGRRRERLVALLAATGFLNILWSLLFFRLRRPDWALAEVALLWLSILALMVHVRHAAPRAALLLLLYLLWVSLAAALNAAIVRLNGPFG